MLTDAERKRIENTKQTTIKSNCIGTVLYICGAIEEDGYVGYREKRWSESIVDKYLDTLVKNDAPELGSVLVVRANYTVLGIKDFISHMGIITQDNPFIVYHRLGLGYKPSIISLNEFMKTYNYYHHFVEFYSRK